MQTGWEFNLLELFYVRGGRFEEDPNNGNRNFSTSGWGVRLSGIPKLLHVLNVPLQSTGIIGYIIHHIDISYNYSDLITDERNRPLSNTQFDGVNFSLSL